MIMVAMQDNPVYQKNFKARNIINLQIMDLIKRSKNGLHFLNQNESRQKNKCSHAPRTKSGEDKEPLRKQRKLKAN